MTLSNQLKEIRNCLKSVKEKDRVFVQSCFENMLKNFPDSSFILDHSRSPEKTSIPAEFQTPEFLKLVRSRRNKDKLIAYVEDLNKNRKSADKMVPLFYDSMSTAAIDNNGVLRGARGRFLIYVPGNPAKWVQFGLHSNLESEDKSPALDSAGVIAVERRDGKNITYLDDYFISADRKSYVANPNSKKNCLNCHSGIGVMPIHFPNMSLDPQWSNVQKINAAMPTISHYAIEAEAPVTLTDLPPMGMSKGRDQEFLLSCIGQTTEGANLLDKFDSHTLNEVERQRLRHIGTAIPAAMDCVSCHTRGTTGTAAPLTWPFGCTTPFLDHLKTFNMPRNNKIALTEKDIPILQSCLLMEYFGSTGDCSNRKGNTTRPLSKEQRKVIQSKSTLYKTFGSPTCKIENAKPNHKPDAPTSDAAR